MADEEALRDYLKWVTTDLYHTRQRLREVEERSHEPIALVGIGCRYPGGVASPEDFWNLLATGQEGIVDVPTDRGWDLEKLTEPDPDGGTRRLRGGFVDDASGFDAGFFGVSPREAVAMDPQQRLLLEVCWEALERAGIDPNSLRGSQTGVFAGASLSGYGFGTDEDLDVHLMTGTSTSVISGRVSYSLGLEGPAVTVDTACSSSLVALHLAVQAVRSGECTLALAGGVTVTTVPVMFTQFSKQLGLAQDGRCKAFSADADGMGISEGAGMVVVERLSDARRNGHPVLAVVRGSAINQDGASNGLAAPNGPSQQRVIRAALASARLSTADIDLVEAHGTGTTLGDPIEAQAVLATYGQGRPADQPVRLGSVKSNIGHTQAGAGIAGVIKLVLSLQHQRMPRTLHAEEPSPHIDWSAGDVELLREARPWPRGERTRRGGVSSFGVSGTNAHVIVEEAPAEEPAEADGENAPDAAAVEEDGGRTAEPLLPGAGAWLVSARSAEGLAAQADRLREWVAARPELQLADVAWSLAATRTAFEHRAVVLGVERGELLAGAQAVAEGASSASVVSGVARSGVQVGLVFAGQGSQWTGMGRELYGSSPLFAEVFDQVCGLLQTELGAAVPVRDVVLGAEGVDAGLADQTLYAQTGLFAFEVALAAVLEAAGVRPDAVVGHSVGEVAAAYVAGVLSLPDACKLVAVRARLMQDLPSGGAMASIKTPEAEVVASFAEVTGEVAVAAVNGPDSVVVSGAVEAVDALVELWRERGHRVRPLRVSHAFHSPAMDPVLDGLGATAQGIEHSRPKVLWAGALSGALVSDPDAGYWTAQARQAVRFADAVAALAREGVSVFLEVGPDGSLSSLGPDAVAEVQGAEPAFVPLQRRTDEGVTGLETGLARAFVHGAPVDWRSVLPTATQVELPTYAFRHQRYWPKGMMSLPGTVKHGAGDPAELGLEAFGHPMLRAVVELAGEDQLVCTGRLSARAQSWLTDHTLGGVALLPGTGFVELVVSAGHQAGCPVLAELTLDEPLTLPADGAGTQIQVLVGAADEDGRRRVDVFARPDRSEEEHSWVRYATALVAPGRMPARQPVRTPADLTAWPPRNARALDVADLYTVRLADVYGPALQGLRGVWQRGDDVFAEVALPEDAGAADTYGIHPVLLDAALLADSVAGPAQGRDNATGPDRIRVPHAWRGVELHAAGASVLRVRLRRDADGTLALTAADTAGTMVLSVDSVATRPLLADQVRADDAWVRDALFTVEWLPQQRGGSRGSAANPALHPPQQGEWALIGADRFAAAEQLNAAGTPVRTYPGVAELAAAAAAGAIVPRTVLACLSGGAADDPSVPADRSGVAAAARRVTTDTLTLLQEWLAASELQPAQLVLLTRGGVPVHPGERVADPAAGAVRGLLRSAQMEHPGRFVLADLPADGDAADTAALPAALAVGEPELALRQRQAYVRRMVRPTGGPASDDRPGTRETAGPRTVLVTGGTGTLGGVVARHLAATGRADEALLLSRSGPAAAGVAALAADVAAHGADVRVVACDAADRDALSRVLDGIPAGRPLRTVVHTAGIIDDGLVDSLTAEQVAAVLRPKVDAAWHLHELTRDSDLDHFVLFSSVASAFGGAGQGNYAAANSFLDTLAGHRRAAGLAGTALAWGPWMPEAGIGRDLDEVMLRRMTGSGLAALSEDEGLTLLDLALDRPEAVLVPARLHKAGLRAQAAATGIPTLWTELADDLAPRRAAVTSAAGATAAAGADAAQQLREQLSALTGPERDRLLLDLVRSHAAAVLGHPSGDAVEAGRPFTDLGFDSLIAVEFRNRLNPATGLRLSSTLVFDYPTPVELAAHLREQLADDLTDAATAVPETFAASAADEPIAIVGMACRFPGGVTSPDELWQMLTDGTEGLSTFPTDRGWDLESLYNPDIEHAGTSYTQVGGFLQEAGAFDPGFFGISPREALAMDPQQRLLLETSWEALERAGIDPATLRGSRTGAFVGGYGSSYLAVSVTDEEELESLGAHLMTGNAASVLSGRVSYTLGLEGPAVTIDTACSSSLVALHLAAQALRAGECSLALAGGVTIMASPDGFLAFSHARGLAADGRSKAFSDDADGMGMAEGAGMLVVERLSDARRNGHEVLAVLRGSAINQDGASNGLTAPNGPSQQRVIRAALANSALTTADVDVVEAHGTGTTLGDPIEAQALLATYGQDRGDRGSLLLGSVKSNIGHTQAAAGVAGVIKMVLALRHEQLPQTLHAEVPSSHVDWTAGEVRLLTEALPWQSDGRVRRAGVSSFGISGTNAHVILEEAPAAEPVEAAGESGDSSDPEAAAVAAVAVAVVPDAGAGAWVVSGRTAEALAAQAGRLREWVSARPELQPADVAWSLAATRSVFEHRAVIVGGGRQELLSGLASVVSGTPSGAVVSGKARSAARPVFAFAGQGSQWVGMGRELASVSPVFAARLAECAAALAPYVEWSLHEVLAGAEGAPALEAADVVQPALWAVMVSLAAVWEAAGVAPEAVVGHSQGEIAAATVAGMLSLEDGARVVALRSQSLKVLAGAGGMLSVSRSAEQVEERLARFGDAVALAAVNGPSAVVVSGEPAALEELKAEFEAEGTRARMVAVDYASHSAQVDRLEDEITSVLAGINPRRGRVPMVSAMTGETLTGEELDAGYWFRSLRATVHFDRAVRTLAARGHQLFVEVTPHPVLMGAMNDTLEEVAQEAGHGAEPAAVCATLRRDEGGTDRLVTSLAEAFAGGAPVDWTSVLPAGQQVELPTYAFRHRRYWPEGMLALPTGGLAATGGGSASPDVEAAFWAAVEGGDLTRLGGTLALDAGRPFHEVLPALASWRRREQDRSTTAGWRYRITWSAVAEPDSRLLSGRWLVVTPAGADDDTAGQCVAALSARGAEVTRVEVPAGTADRTETAELLAQAAEVSAVAGVLSLLALDETPLPDHPVVTAGLAGTLALVQALGDTGIGAPLWLATRGAVAAGRGEALTHPVQAQVWGLGRVVGIEHPERWGGLVDLPETVDERVGARLVAVLAGCGENEVAVRRAGILGRRLSSVARGRGSADGWTPRGSVLLTGGTGAIAGHVARRLAGRGAERLVLTSRSGPAAEGAAALAAELAAAGTRVDLVSCDVSERPALSSLLARIAATGPALSSVLHTAAVLDDGVVDRLTPDRLASVLHVKVRGAELLDELTAELDLDAFVLFSSAASTLGGPGQGNYAAANAYLDALAENRRSRGLAGLSVAWGLWGGAGLAQSNEAIRSRMRRTAMPPMDPQLAVEALVETVNGPHAAVTVMDFDPEQLGSAPGTAHVLDMPLVRDMPEIRRLAAARAGAGSTAAAPRAEGELAARLAGVSRYEQDRILTDLVRAEAAAVLGHDSADLVQARQAFRDLGFDSLTSVELRNQLNAATGLRLPATLAFDHPTPVELAAFLHGELVGEQALAGPAETATAAPVAATVVAATEEPLAIVGMACRFPGGAGSPEEFWELLSSGGDAVGGFPTDRGWDLEGFFDPDGTTSGTSSTESGAFLRDVADFDAGFFGISPREALAMDPQQRLLLETSWEALERAGIDPSSLRGSRTGVFAGGFGSGYAIGMALTGQDGAGVEGHLMTGNSTSVLSGRVSYVLGLEGPAVTVDTACSSSLVALHLAVQAVRSGECSMALAGGVTVMAMPFSFVEFSRQQGLSVDGRCRAFSEDANGTGWAEGAGVLVVERLSDARRKGHKVLAVVRGSAVNQDGASNGLSAPNGPSQQRVIRAALANARLTAADVDVVEAHGTGTTLGDPIEAQALLATYGQERAGGRPLWLGAVKSNIGHTQAAAGVAGVIKMVLALQHEQLPQTLHVNTPTSHVDWSAGEVRLLGEPVAWPAGERLRRAGVSAFGISGTNAHVIVEEAPAEEPAEGDSATAVTDPDALPLLDGEAAGVWVVSARSADGLVAQAGRLREWVAARPAVEPVDVAWSLAATRTAFEHRAVVLGADRGELLAGVQGIAAGVSSASVVAGVARADARVGLVFAGQGAQWAGMGRELYASSPLFAEVFDRVCGLLELELGAAVPVRDVVLGVEGVDAGLADQTLYAQTGLFAFEVALAAVLEAAGVRPDAVVGHSVGEVAAAYVAGVLSLPDACKLVAVRARLMQELPSGGAMASIKAPEAEVVASFAEVTGEAAVAAVNGPDSVVVSGAVEAVDALVELWRERGHRVRPLRVSHAFHSLAMDPVLTELAAVADGIAFSRPEVMWAGALTGELVSEPAAGYWPGQVRQAVRFADAVAALAREGVTVFLEVGPDGSLSSLGPDAVAVVEGVEPAFVPLQRRTDEGVTDLATGLARAFVEGAPVDWKRVLPAATPVELPTYAFRHQRFWPEGVLPLMPSVAAAGGGESATTAAEAEFWAAVEEGDLAQVADTLAVEDEEQLRTLLPALASWRRRELDRSATADWRYRTVWSPVTEPDPRVLAGTWALLAPAGAAETLRQQCADALTARGAKVAVVEVPSGTVDRAELAALLGEMTGAAEISGVLSLLALDEAPLPEHPEVSGGVAATLGLVQALGDAGIGAPLWIATSGAVAAGPGEVLAHPVQAQVWGLGRVVALEHPDRWGGLVDLPESLDERAAARLVGVLAGRGENEVALRPSGALGRRLARATRQGSGTGLSTRGTTLITGGTGAIAGHVARRLAQQGAERLVLTSRSGTSAQGVAALAAELAQAGSAVEVIACDVSERVPLAALLDRIGATGPELASVLHTAAVLDDGVVDRLSVARLRTVLAVKAQGAALLDELTADLDLDSFVLFSAAAATLGGAGQGNYAAANAYLDALAENRRARGLNALAVAWGAWSGGGMAESSGAVRARVERGAMPPMDPQLAVRALDEALRGPDTCVAVMDVDWARLSSGPGTADVLRRPLVRDLPEVRRLAAAADAPAAAGNAEGELPRRLAGLDRTEQERLLTEVVRGEAAVVLGHTSADAVEDRRAFKDLGFDSLTAVELRNRLAAATGLRLPSTLVFDYPTPMALAAFLRGELTGGQPDTAGARGGALAVAAPSDEPLAIVGMACRFPGGVGSPEEFWQLLASGGDAVGGFPTDRGWDLENVFDPDGEREGTSYVAQGAFLRDAAEFDAGFFGISPREALAMDPQQRLMLETSWEALERAGIDPASLRESATGVFAGGFASGYGLGVTLAGRGDESGSEGHVLTGNATSVLSGRVSYVLGLEGPAVTVDTACSSSLMALHLAGQALRSGECTLALAGGATVMATPGTFVDFSRQQGLSADGRCRAFSEDADGTGWAEGVGMLVVERLSDARRNGHEVLAVVRGSAVNQDGASNGLTAPNGPSQQRVIRAALANARLTAADVDVVEAHGTGTRLGDPIEAGALLATYGQERPEGRPLWLGSVKSNIGHTQAAAGVAGIIKMVLALRHEQLPQTLYADEPSSHVDWTAGEVRLLTEARPWQSDGRVRRAAVSAFGMSGTNAHIILEEAPAAPDAADAPDDTAAPDTAPEAPVLSGAGAWLLSGRTADGLAAQAGRLREWTLAHPELQPADVAWSLAATRSVFEYRAVVVGGDRTALLSGLVSLASGTPSGAVVSGVARADTRPVFAFAGQGSQWVGMGRELAGVSPVFAARLAECAAALAPYVEWSLHEVLAGAEGAPALEAADVVQPALWAVMVSLAAVWEAAGVAPEAVVGHSQGEIAAATVAGMLSLEDGARVVALRSQSLKVLAGAGGMLSVSKSAAEVEERLARFGDTVALAAVNGPSAVVVSGEPAALEELKAEFEAEGTRARMVAVDYASHSAQVDRLEDEITSVLAGISPRRGRVPMVSAMTGETLTGEELDAGYWFRSLRATVHFDRAVRTLASRGHQLFVEVTPHPVLMGAMNDTLEDVAQEAGHGAEPAAVCPTLRRDDGGTDRLVTSFAEAFVRGADVDWRAVLPAGQQVELPTYAFRHSRFWPEGILALPVPGAVTDTDGTSAEVDAAFWAAVEGGDLARLGETLSLDAGRPFHEVLPALASWRRREQDRSTTAGWRYRITWSAIAEPDAGLLSGRWLVVAPTGADGGADGGAAEQTAAALSARGADAVLVEVPAGTTDRDALAAELTGHSEASAVAGVLSLLALDETPLPDHPVVTAGVAANLALVQALGDIGIEAPLWLATRGAVAAGPGEALARPVQAQAWGFGRVVALEQPQRWGGLVDLPETVDERAGTRLVAVLAGCGENEVAIRSAGVLGRRMSRVPRREVRTSWTPKGTVLVTGGTGAIAGHLSQWLVGRGAERIVLTGRSGPAAGDAAARAAELAEAGTHVDVISCDVSRRAPLTGLLDWIGGSGPALSSVLHTAAVLDDGVVDRLTPARMETVLGVKAHGAELLDELTSELDLDAFVLFSSAASTLGGPGQGNYAAANAYLDALAENRRSRGLAGLSVAWGLWGGAGLAQSNEAIRSRMRRIPMPPMDPQLAVRALGESLDGPEPNVAVMDFDWQQLGSAPGSAGELEMPLVRDIPEIRRLAAERAAAGSTAPRGGGEGELAARVAGLSRAEQVRVLTDAVRAEAAAVLGHASADSVQARQAFKDLGFDSLTAVELRNRLGAVTGLRLPATLVFDHPTPTALAERLRTELAPEESVEAPLLTELDRLEAALRSGPVDAPVREEATARLRRLLELVGEQPGDRGRKRSAAAIDDASDDELFAFVEEFE